MCVSLLSNLAINRARVLQHSTQITDYVTDSVTGTIIQWRHHHL